MKAEASRTRWRSSMACSGATAVPHRMLAGGPDVRMSARHGRQSGMSDGCSLRNHFNRPSPAASQQPLMVSVRSRGPPSSCGGTEPHCDRLAPAAGRRDHRGHRRVTERELQRSGSGTAPRSAGRPWRIVIARVSGIVPVARMPETNKSPITTPALRASENSRSRSSVSRSV